MFHYTQKGLLIIMKKCAHRDRGVISKQVEVVLDRGIVGGDQDVHTYVCVCCELRMLDIIQYEDHYEEVGIVA